ncbi:MAG: hypothetical protein JOZ87_21055 [Chloroflexi bacterium]|nr:hypothetical protein [Chloroflexota bacterium]
MRLTHVQHLVKQPDEPLLIKWSVHAWRLVSDRGPQLTRFDALTPWCKATEHNVGPAGIQALLQEAGQQHCPRTV